MEQLLHLFSQLADIIVRAVPAFIVFVLLHLYLKRVLFQPLERVLEERRTKTQGAVDASEAIVRQAESKLDSYERALNQARADIYKEQEVARHTLAARQAAALEEARARVGQQIAAARSDLNAEVEQARATLSTEADRLAETIVAGVLAGRN